MGKKKRRKRVNPFPMIIRMLLIIIGSILLLWLGIRYIKENRKQVKGSWVREVDYTDEVSLNMSKWICSAIGGNQINTSDYLSDASVEVDLVFDNNNTYSVSINKQSYRETEALINSASSKVLEKLIADRLSDIGITEQLDINGLFMSAYGISINDYVKDYVPSFMPSYSDICASYDDSGDYVIEDGLLYMGHGTKEELLKGQGFQYMVGDMLVYMDDDKAYVYYKPDKNEKITEDIIIDENDVSDATNEDSILDDIKGLWKLEVNAASSAYPNLLSAVNNNTGDEFKIGAYYVDYVGNIYLSLRDLAVLLTGTEKAYDFAITKEDIIIRTGKDYIPSGGENMEFLDETKELGYKINSNLSSKQIVYNDEPRKYYLMSAENSEGNKDYFMSILDICLMMDITIDRSGDRITVYPDRPFVIDLEKMQEECEYFEMSRSALVGDVTSGEVFYSYHEDEQVPMASTTKLMTYIVIMDALYNGEISENDTLTASDKVIALSKTADGVIKMEDGQTASLNDAIKGMLIGSSNECSLMLAEYVAGSEEAFVERMNAKAKEIGLSDLTRFYNCNGLPIYCEDAINAKKQNHITAKDMFDLCKYLMSLYPEITKITSVDKVELESFDNLELKNTNPILYNVPNMVGLKTGSTAVSGACLVAAAKTNSDEDAHVIVSALYGTESSILRAQMSEVLIRYGLQYFDGVESSGFEDGSLEIPDNLEAIIRNLINVARKELTR